MMGLRLEHAVTTGEQILYYFHDLVKNRVTFYYYIARLTGNNDYGSDAFSEWLQKESIELILPQNINRSKTKTKNRKIQNRSLLLPPEIKENSGSHRCSAGSIHNNGAYRIGTVVYTNHITCIHANLH